MTRMGHRWKILAAAVALTGLVGFGTFVGAQTPSGPPPGGGPPAAGAPQSGPHRWGPRRGPMMMRGFGALPGLRRLGLSDSQRQQIRSLVDQYRKTWAPQLLPLRIALQQAIQKNDSNAVTIASNNLAVVQLQTNLARAALRASIMAVLTPAQQQQVEQFAARMNQRTQRMLQRLQKQGGGGR